VAGGIEGPEVVLTVWIVVRREAVEALDREL
jgi:hypothetical protein